MLILPQTTSHSLTRSSSKPDETTKRFLSLRCRNHSTTTSSNTLCATTNHPTNYPSSISSSLLTAARYHQLITHPKVHLKDLPKVNHPRPTSLTAHQTCLLNKTRSATSPRDHRPNNQRNQALAALTLNNQHHQMDKLLSTSSQEVSKTSLNHHNPQS